ncbi:hypothetical protein HAX54_009948 [Datura stramonium]|uniref:Uncharacterized protein n=1 Tax=Datura stramonium TaxID=4076 RepID=A0ABS8TFJ0_DATST|nr:hypothetical protein [Datura stramonium]
MRKPEQLKTELSNLQVEKGSTCDRAVGCSTKCNSEMEAELRRLKVQSDPVEEAAEAAAAMLSTGNNGK